MTDDSDEILGYNFWGDPQYRTVRKRGRPPFEWTQENSHKVSMLLAMGWTNDRIATCIVDPRTGKPISTPTLKRHFRSELKVRLHARDMLTAKRLMVAADAAFGGNVGAMRLLDQLIEKNDAAVASDRLTKPSDDDDAPVGKKEKARREAMAAAGAGGAWGGDLKPGRYDS